MTTTRRFIATPPITRSPGSPTGAPTIRRGRYALAVVRRDLDELIDSVELQVDNNRQGMLGCVLARRSWGNGYATEAASALLRYGFENLGLQQISATCGPRVAAIARRLRAPTAAERSLARGIRRRTRAAGRPAAGSDSCQTTPEITRSTRLEGPNRPPDAIQSEISRDHGGGSCKGSSLSHVAGDRLAPRFPHPGDEWGKGDGERHVGGGPALKRYGSRSAVEELSFVAHSGEVLGLLGPNGAGKTTTIRLLTTMVVPTSGTFRVAGLPATAAAEIRRRVGVLPESSGYPRQQTGREYLSYHARLYGLSSGAARRVADRQLAELGLAERAESPIAGYSRGMRQRLGIARALVHDPAVVFLDEPTLGLDPAGQAQVLTIIRDIARSRGATVVLSTHTLPEVEEVCSTVLILDRDRVVVAGGVGEVIETAVVERSAQLRVPADQVPQARMALAAVAGLSVDLVDGQPDILNISLRPSPGGPSVRAGNAMNPAAVAVAEAGVPILSFQVEGARLSDAYHKATATEAR